MFVFAQPSPSLRATLLLSILDAVPCSVGKLRACFTLDGCQRFFNPDPFQLNQVFMNLLVNAPHGLDGPGTITIRTGHDDDWVKPVDRGKPDWVYRILLALSKNSVATLR